jgi:iron complex transport system substrate-binding protein
VSRRPAGLLLLGLLLGVTGSAAAAEVVDMMGRRVAAPPRPARVVSLAPSLTETVFALGAEAQLVGVSESCDYPPAARQKPRIGGIYTPSLEAILALRPDLVLATSEGNRLEHVRELAGLGLAVYVVRPVDFASTLEAIARVGALLGRDEAAARLVGTMRRRAEAVAQAVAGRPRPRVLYVVWGSPLIVPGRDTLITDLIARAGGESVTATEGAPYPRLSLEAAAERRPERVILGRHGTVSVADQLRAWESLAVLPAVREGRVEAVDGDLVHRPGPRVIDGLLALARILHPERVP